MKRHFFIFLLYSICCLLFFGNCIAQNPKVDSLENALGISKQDTTKVLVLNELFIEHEFVDELKAKIYLDKAIELSKKIGYKKGEANTLILFGYFAEDKGNNMDALKYYQDALKIYASIKHKQGMASSYNNIAAIYSNQGNYSEALKSLFSCLKIDEEMNNKEGVAHSYSNIAIIYGEQDNYEESLKNHLLALKIYQEVGDQYGIAQAYNNLGNLYTQEGNYSEALKNFLFSMEIKKAMGDQKGLGSTYNNIASVYIFQADLELSPKLRLMKLEQALENCNFSLKIREALGDKAGMASVYNNIGVLFTKQKKYSDAEMYLNKSNVLAKEIGSKEYLRENYSALAELNRIKGNYKEAFKNNKLFILYRDSLDNEETRKQTIQTQMTYDFEKKEAVAKAEHKKEFEKQELVASEKSRKQTIVIIFVISGLLLVLVFSGFIFRSLRITRKQKNIIENQKNIVEQQKQEVEHQKSIVEEHQKEIIDSITYARRIQQSLLPTEKYINKTINRLKK